MTDARLAMEALIARHSDLTAEQVVDLVDKIAAAGLIPAEAPPQPLLDPDLRVDIATVLTDHEPVTLPNFFWSCLGCAWEDPDREMGIGGLGRHKQHQAAVLLETSVHVNSLEEAERAFRDAAVPEPETPGHADTSEITGWHRDRFGEVDLLIVGTKLAEETGEVLGAIVKRTEGAVRPDKGMFTRDDWTRALHDEIGDAGIVLHTLAGREGHTLNDLITRRYRDDVARRTGQETPR